jgi:hypothetical protein
LGCSMHRMWELDSVGISNVNGEEKNKRITLAQSDKAGGSFGRKTTWK